MRFISSIPLTIRVTRVSTKRHVLVTAFLVTLQKIPESLYLV